MERLSSLGATCGVSGQPYSRVSQPVGHGRVFNGPRPDIIEMK